MRFEILPFPIYASSLRSAIPNSRKKMSYAELHCKTNYSFLTGASHADELVTRAVELGYSAIAVTDENTLAGVVRAYAAARDTSLKLIIGAELIPGDGPPLVLWATDRRSYANLSRLLTVGRRRAPKGECWLRIDDIAEYSTGLLAGVIPHLPGNRVAMQHLQQDHVSYEWYRIKGRHQRIDNRRLHRYAEIFGCLLYTSPSPRDRQKSRMPSSA